MRIALDVMGGDFGPRATVEGAYLYVKETHGADHIVLVGDENQIKEQLQHIPQKLQEFFSIVHASQNIGMNESPTEAIKKKIDSSMVVGLRLHRDNEVDAFVSAGNTGAQLAASLVALKRIPGVKRPAIGSFLPCEKGLVFIIDVGANVDTKPMHLLQFALMGNIFVREVFTHKEPSVGLLSVGEEESKGNEVTRLAHQLFKEHVPNFHGNIEGRDILRGTADIIVCDGYVGNVILKMAESIMGVLMKGIKKSIGKNIMKNLGAFLVKPAFRDLKKVYDYEEYGGVPLLGVNGISIICHGSSNAKAIKNALKVAQNMNERNVNKLIGEQLKIEGAADG
ncbi:MAG: phosphate acyltransferase PlsX [Calditrichaceae bacterium]|nr:phosphate acyltransferase PlsX [Calditrichaceae bacterium]